MAAILALTAPPSSEGLGRATTWRRGGGHHLVIVADALFAVLFSITLRSCRARRPWVAGVSTRFGERVIHHQLDLDVQQAKCWRWSAPLGCGKTTLLRHMIGLTQPAAGVVGGAGRAGESLSSFSRLSAACASAGVLFQSGALFSALSVLGERRPALC